MIPAEFTDRVDDLIHLPEGHSVHLLVEGIKIRFDLFVVWVVFAVAFVEHGQDRFAVTKVWRVLYNVFSQCLKEFLKHFVGGGQFCPGIAPRGSGNRIPLEPQRLFRGSQEKTTKSNTMEDMPMKQRIANTQLRTALCMNVPGVA